MRMLKYLFTVILCLVMFVGWGTDAFAAESRSVEAAAQQTKEYQVLILDQAQLLTPEEHAKLLQDMEELKPYGNVVFQTVKLKRKTDFEKFSEATYYKLFGNEPGVIFQIDMGNRKLTLSSSTGMDDIIRSERDSIVDNIYELATDKKYYECAQQCFYQIRKVINNEEIAHDMKHISNAVLALILGLLVNFLIICATTRKKISKKKLLGEMGLAVTLSDVVTKENGVTKVYSPKSSSSSRGGGSSGGSRSGGGGGGFSGGSSSHGF